MMFAFFSAERLVGVNSNADGMMGLCQHFWLQFFLLPGATSGESAMALFVVDTKLACEYRLTLRVMCVFEIHWATFFSHKINVGR